MPPPNPASSAYRLRMLAPSEVRRILRRAAELQDAARGPAPLGRGHTIAELERIAADAGIGDQALRQALDVESTPQPAPAPPWTLLGAPTTLAEERSVQGRVAQATPEQLAAVLRAATGEAGQIMARGDTFRWVASRRAGRLIEAAIEPAGDGGVTVRVHEDLVPMRARIGTAVMVLSTLVLMVLAALAGHFAPELAPFTPIVWIVGMYVDFLIAYRWRFGQRQRQVRSIASELSTLVETSGARIVVDPARVESLVEVADRGVDERRVDERDGDEPDDRVEASEPPRRERARR